MEINTRLQVEHPVTEEVTGLDLVEWQLRVAAGEPLPLAPGTGAAARPCHRSAPVRRRSGRRLPARLGHASRRLRLPDGRRAHVRIDAGVVEGDTVTIFYDPMIAKLIVWDADRPRALARLREALAALRGRGPEVQHRLPRTPGPAPARDRGHASTPATSTATSTKCWHGDQARPRPAAGRRRTRLLVQEAEAGERAAAGSDPARPGRIARWLAARPRRRAPAGVRACREPHRTGCARPCGRLPDRVGWRRSRPGGARLQHGELSLRLDGAMRRLRASADANRVLVHDGRQRLRLHSVAGVSSRGYRRRCRRAPHPRTDAGTRGAGARPSRAIP